MIYCYAFRFHKNIVSLINIFIISPKIYLPHSAHWFTFIYFNFSKYLFQWFLTIYSSFYLLFPRSIFFGKIFNFWKLQFPYPKMDKLLEIPHRVLSKFNETIHVKQLAEKSHNMCLTPHSYYFHSFFFIYWW